MTVAFRVRRVLFSLRKDKWGLGEGPFIIPDDGWVLGKHG